MKKVAWYCGVALVAASMDYFGCLILYVITTAMQNHSSYTLYDWIWTALVTAIWTGYCTIGYLAGSAMANMHPLNWNKSFKSLLWDED